MFRLPRLFAPTSFATAGTTIAQLAHMTATTRFSGTDATPGGGATATATAAMAAAATAATPGKVKVTFIDHRSKRTECQARVGETLLSVALQNQLDIEAACDGTCACSTCHVYVSAAHFATLPKISEDEEDMLDLALDRKATSRLACQLTVTRELDGVELTLPATVASQLS